MENGDDAHETILAFLFLYHQESKSIVGHSF